MPQRARAFTRRRTFPQPPSRPLSKLGLPSLYTECSGPIQAILAFRELAGARGNGEGRTGCGIRDLLPRATCRAGSRHQPGQPFDGLPPARTSSESHGAGSDRSGLVCNPWTGPGRPPGTLQESRPGRVWWAAAPENAGVRGISPWKFANPMPGQSHGPTHALICPLLGLFNSARNARNSGFEPKPDPGNTAQEPLVRTVGGVFRGPPRETGSMPVILPASACRQEKPPPVGRLQNRARSTGLRVSPQEWQPNHVSARTGQ